MKLFGHAREVVGKAKDVVAEYDAQSPHTAGQVRQAIGGLLIADGLVGLENPLGGRSRPGIFGHLFQALFGLIFVVVGVFVFSMTSADGDATTTGTITDVRTHTGDDSTTCSLRAEFWVDDIPYRAGTTHSSSSFCSENVGGTVDIRYDSANPADADIDEGSMLWFVLVFPAAGLLVMLPSLIGLAFSAAAIFFGWRLLRSGRAMSAANPPTSTDQGIVAEAKEKFIEVVATVRGGSSTRSAATSSRAIAQSLGLIAAPATPQVPTGPPVAPAAIAAGWYRTADGASERWHDGINWTTHVRPYAPPPHH
ncbi:DUF3592 domain-containing protein [Nocardioides gilvus]|uniref:DUF3592 domain-containing protein n=1 Tax=Nocardioides gilvus TaxID=1735589 RepID=UPI0013A5A605|nr:DUF3592 domain-containing protein [Nocardioides gilvus]